MVDEIIYQHPDRIEDLELVVPNSGEDYSTQTNLEEHIDQIKEQPLPEPNHDDFKPKKPTYTQNWIAYDKAKTNQTHLFHELLAGLLQLAIIEEKHSKKGRIGYSNSMKIFCMCIKVYYKSNLRKCESLLKELKRLNYIDKIPCFKTIDNFFNDKELTSIIDDLILITSLPLAKIEKFGAMDSTGFSISRFDRWNEFKWGKNSGKERIWRKAHIYIGTRSGICVSVKVTEKNVVDVTMVEEVMGNKSKNFEMSYFVADKAYLSRRVLEFINTLNMTPIIPFKSNSIRKARGSSMWSKMYRLWKDEPEMTNKIYHRRSLIESSFNMVKTPFGDHLMTKTFKANENEIKTKFLCNNLLILIQEAYESDIEIDFESCVKKTNSV